MFLLIFGFGPDAARADNAREAQWHLGFLHVTDAHRYSQGEGVTVAVIDTGVDAGHPDLIGNVLPGTETFQDATGTGDGRADTDGHGTAMAGLIAAHGHGPDGSAGVLGIAPKARILPIRDRTGNLGDSGGTSAGIRYAVAHGAKVICLAEGRSGAPDLRDAVKAALDAGVVIVAAVGNRPEAPNIVDFPAAFPGVIAAAGVDRNGDHADLSVTGKEVVLAAPAVDVVSTGIGGDYHVGRGTSDATAIIAGAAALVRSRFPDLSGEEVVHRLTATAIDKGPPGRDDQYGYGIVNLVDALTKDVPPLHPTTSASAAPAPPPTSTTTIPTAAIVAALVLLLAAGAGGTIWLIRHQNSRQQRRQRSWIA